MEPKTTTERSAMSITSRDIQEQGFGTERNGYDMKEVDVFLEHVASEIDQMQSDYEYELSAARDAAKKASGPSPEQENEIRRLRETVASLQQKLSDQHTSESVISEAFIAAQKSANSIKEDARAEAEKTIADAQAKAHQIVDEAAEEKQRIIDEIERLDQSRTSFVEEYASLIKHFNDEATKVFTRSGISADSSVRATHEPAKSFSANKSGSGLGVGFAEAVAATNDTLYGAVDSIDIDDDID